MAKSSLHRQLTTYLGYALIATLPLERIPSYDLRISSFEITLRLSHLIGLALLAINLPWLWRKRSQFLKTPWIWLGGFLVLATLSSGLGLNTSKSLLVLSYTGFMIFLAWLVSSLAGSQLAIWRKILLISALVIAAFGFYQYFGDLLGLSYHLTGLRPHYTKQVFGFPRIQSTALEPLFLASYLLLPICLAATSYLFTKLRRYLAIYTLLLAVLVMTLSRGGYAGLLLGLVIVLGFAVRQKLWGRIGVLVVGGLLGVGLAASLISFGTAIDVPTTTSTTARKSLARLQNHTTNISTGDSAEDRTITRGLALKIIHEKPWLGVGPGNFGTYAAKARPDRYPGGHATVNNEPLELAAENGLPAALAFLGFVVSLGWQLVRRLRVEKAPTRLAWQLGVLAALAGLAVQYQTFSTLYIIYIWVTLGIAVGISGHARETSNQA